MTVAPLRRIQLLIAAMVATTAVLSLSVDGFFAFEVSDLGALGAIAVMFLLSEKLLFHVEARAQAMSYSPSDVALALGVVFVSPVGLVVARLLGALIGQLLFRRPARIKLAFNLTNFVLETTVAVVLYRFVAGADPVASLTSWVALVGALFAALLTGGFLVAGAISCFEDGLATRLRAELVNSPIFHLPGAGVAAALATGALAEPFLGLVVASLVPVIWLIVRSHGRLLHRYTDLVGVHQFSREIGDVSEIAQILGRAAEQIAENLRAEQVAIRIWDADGVRSEAFHGDGSLTTQLPNTVADLDESTAFDDEYGTETRAEHELERLAVMLGDEQGTVGCVVVSGHLGVGSGFEVDDLRRLRTMAQQLTLAVRKGQLHAQIRHEATHDRLTGLTNRGFFEEWVDEQMALGEHGCVLFIDLDRFKDINDAFGHHAGDELLRIVAHRLRMHSPVDGLTSRFGGDEFAVYAPDIGLDEACALAERLAGALEEPCYLTHASVVIAPSIGVVDGSSEGTPAATLLRRADIAMYEAKKLPGSYAVHSAEMEANESARLKMLVDLRVAIAEDRLDVHFQPQVDMRTGRVTGAEALVRWHHPDLGPLSPEIFVELAEAAGLIDALTDRVLAKALSAAAQWQRRGWDVGIAVNISARSLLDDVLVEMVETHLDRTGLDASRLTLEITESTMMADPVRTHRMLHTLTSLGVTISVDDFGTGYSSLSSLGDLPVSELKIDRSFVMAMNTSNHDEIIVRSTIDLAHNLGLRAVAEGVEDDILLHRLEALDCDLAQGFGISRPLPLERFNHWFAKRHNDLIELESLEPPAVDMPVPLPQNAG